MPKLHEKLSTIILAAGIGKRMKSKTPKILHRILGRPIISFVLELARDVGSTQTILVVSDRSDAFFESLGDAVCYAIQKEPLGTGDAAARGLEKAENANVLILCGDVPLLQHRTILDLIKYHKNQRADVTILTCEINDPFGYGRIIRGPDGWIKEIIEQSDATPEQQMINEINAGVYYGNAGLLMSAISEITADNKQGEYYLTDAIHLIVKNGMAVSGYKIDRVEETIGINTQEQLAYARALVKERWFHLLMERGVHIEDPATTNIDLSVKIGDGVIIKPYSLVEGNTTINEGETIGPFVWIQDGKVIYSTSA